MCCNFMLGLSTISCEVTIAQSFRISGACCYGTHVTCIRLIIRMCGGDCIVLYAPMCVALMLTVAAAAVAVTAAGTKSKKKSFTIFAEMWRSAAGVDDLDFPRWRGGSTSP